MTVGRPLAQDAVRALLALVLLCTACSRGSEVTRGSDERLGPGSWSVDGVEHGSRYEDVEALLGPGEQVVFREGAPVYRFRNQIAVTFDSDLEVTRVSGNELLRDGQAVLATGRSGDAVVSTLGTGFVIARFSPTTSGVFTTGSVLNGVEYYYHDGVNRFLVFVNRGGEIGGIHSAPMEEFPLPEE